MRTEPTRAIVAGAGIAGLLAARALADHVDEVVVLERERLVDDVAPRGHVPQGRHIHLLLKAGLGRMGAWFPGFEAELEGLGAVRVDGMGARVYQGGAYRAAGDWGGSALSLTRPLLERTVRRRVQGLANVTVEDGVLVDSVSVEGGRVVGARVGPGGGSRPVPEELRRADLVVDCSGRNSRIALALEKSGDLVVPTSRVRVDIAYASTLLERSDDDVDGSFVVCVSDPPGLSRAAAAMPVEGGRWQVTFFGMHGDVPPRDDAGLLDFARSLPAPTVGELLARCRRVGAIETYRYPSSQRRHYEKVRALLPGLVTLGDAACSFDPVYGQGMTAAAKQAELLGAVVGRLGVRSSAAAGAPRTFHRRAARIIDAPWSIAVGGDFLHPQTTGPRPRGTSITNPYVRQVIRASHTSVPVARTFNQVLNLVHPPTALMSPAMLVRVVFAARRSPAVTGAPVAHPSVPADHRHGLDAGGPERDQAEATGSSGAEEL